jgi:hypothetical protein
VRGGSEETLARRLVPHFFAAARIEDQNALVAVVPIEPPIRNRTSAAGAAVSPATRCTFLPDADSLNLCGASRERCEVPALPQATDDLDRLREAQFALVCPKLIWSLIAAYGRAPLCLSAGALRLAFPAAGMPAEDGATASSALADTSSSRDQRISCRAIPRVLPPRATNARFANSLAARAAYYAWSCH